ncbi:MAG: protein TolQ [Piscirickettsiaceae bacterium]|nr:MAG: protein TolQ [Piscirickettsiaceae bacterium]PCI70624.1 MAG: protein TolQ [Piscirickettsiaceae bacterium]
MTTDLSIVHLVMQAGPIVKLVMLMLAIASVISWTFIFAKHNEFKSALRVTNTFEKRFWSGIDLNELHRQVSSDHYEKSGVEDIFYIGFQEYKRLRTQQGMEPMHVVEGARRAMQAQYNREMDELDNHLPFLATVGSTSPYVGLFGTVWGIMSSFQALANMKQATLALVAPGISEALVATAMGLLAAIPAVVAYNRFSTHADRLATRYETFMDDFTNVLQRQAHIAAK